MFAPRYFKNFICTADKCTHSCCIGWEIDIDEDTLAYYKSLPEPLGAKILRTVAENDEGAHFALTAEKRCKNLDKHGLCRIYKSLGHEGLCDICREHPRFYHISDREEAGLGAACEAAAALILASDGYADFVAVDGDGLLYDPSAEFNPRTERELLYGLLADKTLSLTARLAAITARYGAYSADRTVLDGLEYLDDTHRALFAQAMSTPTALSETHAEVCERFFAYLVYRHASPARSVEDFVRAVRLALFLLTLFTALIEKGLLSPIAAAVAVSEEIEYSEQNTQALLFAAMK